MKTKYKVILSFVTIFLLGGVSGYLLNDALNTAGHLSGYDRTERGSEWNGRSSKSKEDRAEQRREWMDKARSHLSDQLDLSDEQKTPFFDHLHQYHTEIKDSVHTLKTAENRFIREHYMEFKEEISSVLNESQVEKLDSFFHPDSVRKKRMRYNSR